MTCTVLPLADLDATDRDFIAAGLTKPGSDFQKKLRAGLLDGRIAIVRDAGEIIGWARTEKWLGGDASREWDTLESFVSPAYRSRGIASFGASGLRATFDAACYVAVFHPHMLLVARRAGLRPILFHREGPAWLRA